MKNVNVLKPPQLFNQIARRYDFLNHLLSLGLDYGWRRTVVKHLPDQDDLLVLDLATGTADLLITLCRKTRKLRAGLGLDLSPAMLALGRKKIARLGLSEKLTLREGSAGKLPCENQSIDVVTIAFGIRNFANPQAALIEIHRALKPSGRLIILEFSLPPAVWLRRLYLLYFRHVMPRLGAWISGHPEAYRYLNQSVEQFPHGDKFCALLIQAGFQKLRMRPLTFGIATIYQADKSSHAQ